jgi:CubicO group peptidase (beta-lactamase class C family)
MLASVSKVFTAAAVLLLIEDGLIGGLNSDICDVIPSTWAKRACRNPRFPNVPVTWRMLVTHRSSLTEDISDVTDVNLPLVIPHVP